jgi:hypothetical protein
MGLDGFRPTSTEEIKLILRKDKKERADQGFKDSRNRGRNNCVSFAEARQGKVVLTSTSSI